jgi:hypothetical protein
MDATIVSASHSGYRQEFHLPSDYRRGTESGELRYPALSGLQLLVEVEDDCARYAAFDYKLQYQIFGLGWVTATEGVAIGAPADGLAWITTYFDPIEIDAVKAAARWQLIFNGGRPTTLTDLHDEVVPYVNGEANVLGTRIVVDLISGDPYHFIHNSKPAFLYLDPFDNQVYFSYEQGVKRFVITSPNPLNLPYNDRAWNYDGTVLDGANGEAAFGFRILSLTAEEGIDFLGNEYRSVVIQNGVDNISTALGADPDSFWLSKPNPSKFAVENLYFDVRRPGSTTYGRSNLISNPSFELQGLWTADDDGGSSTPADGSLIVPTSVDFADKGFKVGVITKGTGGTYAGITTDATNRIPAVSGKAYSLSALIKPDAINRNCYVYIQFWDSLVGGSVINAPNIGVNNGNNLGWTYVALNGQIAPPGTQAIRAYVRVFGVTTGNSIYFDSIMLNEGVVVNNYFDGDMAGYVWSNTSHQSTSFELVPPSIEDTETVIDRILVDPITPGAYFNIYYTNEGNPGENEDQWEGKLWTRVPQTYRMERRETHVLPEPIKAKYLKIEFSHLQARYYAPGDFQQSIRYKKHPKWVLDYFLARMQTDAAFLAERVAVVYDALDLAYGYYLDDLGQEPQTTIDVNNSVASDVANFLSNRNDVSDRIDPVTLDKINLVLNPYREHPASRGTPNTLLGEYARQTVSPTDDYAVEAARAQSPASADVSSLNRDRVVVEQNYPVMFFYLTCRHAYREIEAKFSHDRAYFVGVRQIAFLRDNYMTAFDTGTYIEPAADTQNIERNEFV